MDNILILLHAVYAKALMLIWRSGCGRCMPKNIAWGPVGRPKAPHGGGTFAADTPQVLKWVYINERNWKNAVS
jgi:hypothetical protein